MSASPPASSENATPPAAGHHMRFHIPHFHMNSVFGEDWFALKAEAFARFFGTPVFLVTQTIIVSLWIGLNVFGVTQFDLYPFILLNLAFSLQAAYAAPLILLAQTRQADRDKLLSEADAQHREDLALAAQQRMDIAVQQTQMLREAMELNTQLTDTTRQLSLQIEALTREIHERAFQSASNS